MRNHTVNYAQLFENQNIISISFSTDGPTRAVLSITENIEQLGFKREDILAPNASWGDLLHPEDHQMVMQLGQTYLKQKLPNFRLDYRLVNPAGEIFWIKEYSYVTRNAEGKVESINGILLRLADGDVEKAYSRTHVEMDLAMGEILTGLQHVDLEESFDFIFRCVNQYLDISRIMLFEQADEKKSLAVIRQWPGAAGTNKKAKHTSISKAHLTALDKGLKTHGLIIVNNGETAENLGSFVTAMNINSMAALPIYYQGWHCGGIVFADDVAGRQWDGVTMDFLRSITKLVSMLRSRQRNQEQILSTHRTCEIILNNIDSYIYAVDPKNNNIVFANNAFRADFGSDCIGQNANLLIPLAPENQIHYTTQDANAPASSWNKEARFYEIYLEPQRKWLSINQVPVPWTDGHMVNLVHCYDNTAHKHYEEAIRRQAYTDYLTGLPNRHHCDDALNRLVVEQRGSNMPFYIFFIDLDDFKVVNDSFGHDYGDAVLKSFAEYLKATYTGKNQIFRLGGDEFVIVIDHANGINVPEYLDSLMERAKEPWKALDKEFYCSLSIGVVEFIARREDATSILKKADIAMYQAKKLGKNNYVYYTAELDSYVATRSAMERMLRTAIRDNFTGIEILYQPYYNLHNGNLIGAEALLRGRGEDGTLISAGEFIALAEYLGLIVPIGEHVLSKAALLCKRVNDAGYPNFTIAVNFSAVQFKDKNVVPHIGKLLSDIGVKYNNVILGINEDVAMDERRLMMAHCHELRNMGIRMAMDDFGSGNASFINMRNLPVDLIKVSPIYLYAHEDEFTGHFMEMVANLCHLSGKQLCMSGVETKAQLEFCRKLKADVVQGFLLNTPMEEDAIFDLLHTGQNKLSF